MTNVKCQYDAIRGGFRVGFYPFTRNHSNSFGLLDGLANVFTTEDSHIVAVESFFDSGGLPLAGFVEPVKDGSVLDELIARESKVGLSTLEDYFQMVRLCRHNQLPPSKQNIPEGTFPLSPEGGKVGRTVIKQSVQEVRFWFDQTLSEYRATRCDTQNGVSIWLLGVHVLGVSVEFSRLVVKYPLDSIEFGWIDFK